jgi:hypothetical protein
MCGTRRLGRRAWELVAILFWLAMMAALVVGIYEFLSGPKVLGY